MADTKISALTALAGASVDSAADVLPIVDTSVTTTKKITVAELDISLRSTGKVLQVVGATDAGSSTTSTSLTNMNNSAVGITPLSTTSHLLIEVQFIADEGVIVGTNSIGFCQLFDVQAAAVIGALNSFTASAETEGVAISVPACLRAYIANTVLTARSFTVRASTSNAGAAATVESMVWSITEIKD